MSGVVGREGFGRGRAGGGEGATDKGGEGFGERHMLGYGWGWMNVDICAVLGIVRFGVFSVTIAL